MTIPELSHLDSDEIEAVVGPAAFARAWQYADSRVLGLDWDPDNMALGGKVLGRGSVYATEAWFMPDACDDLRLDVGGCSCPVQVNCKHVAAIVMVAAGFGGSAARFGSGEVNRRGSATVMPMPQPPPAWEQTLQGLIGSPRAVAPAHTPLGIELALQPAVGTTVTGLRLMARVVRSGRDGWVNGGLHWSALDSWQAQRGNHPAAHVGVLRELFALHSARASRPSYGYYGSATKTLDLGEVGASLWPLLDDAARVGLAVVHAFPDLGPVQPYGQAELSLDMTRQTGAGHLLTPMLVVDGDPADPIPITFLGAEGHGVVHVARTDLDASPDPRHWRIRLARLATPASPPLRRMLMDDQRLQIPAGEEERFASELWPRLRHVATITSSDGSFTPPVISRPTLSLHTAFGPDHTTRLEWSWDYDVGGMRRRTGLQTDPAAAGYRDARAEDAVLAGMDVDFEPFDVLGTDGQLCPVVELTGMQTARVAAELLPLLDGRPDVSVEVEGTPADFREVGDSLVIGVSTQAVPDETDWFDLGVSITADGRDVPFTDVFLALAAGDPHLLLEDGAYFSLDKPELQSLARLIEEARALQESPSGPLRLSRFQADLWAELAALGVVTRQADAWRRQVGALLETDPIEAAEVPAGLAATLRPYQREGFAWLAFLWQHGLGGILADDMGLGKTVQALALILHARAAQPAAPPFLVLAPTSVVSNWAAEAARFAPGLRVATVDSTLKRAGHTIAEVVAGADVVVTSYQLFRLDIDAYAAAGWAGLLLDEAQMAKNHRSKLYGCIRRLMTPFKLAITGTPMENNLMELWSLLSITAPGLFPDPKAFEGFYRRPIERQGDIALLAQLRRRIRPLVKRRTKEQVAADLPPKQEQVLEVELHPRHRRIYATQLQRERQRILGLLDDFDRNRFTILRSITILRQLSLHAGLVDSDHDQVPCAKLDALVEHLTEVVDGGHRALVFSQFTGFLAHVRQRLDAEGIEYCYLDGRTRKRDAVLRRFKNGAAPVFLISLKAGGFGLNLTEADYCFLLDPWWNPATEAQAIDRTHRIGQTRNVMVYRLIAKDTIEQKVMALAQRKAELFGGVMGDGEVFSGSLTRQDIHALFG